MFIDARSTSKIRERGDKVEGEASGRCRRVKERKEERKEGRMEGAKPGNADERNSRRKAYAPGTL